MSCKKAWPINFLVMNLNRSFVDKEYAMHHKKRLLEREMSKLPDTMEAAQISKEHTEKEKVERKKYNEVASELEVIEKQIENLVRQKISKERNATKYLRNADRHKRNALRPGAQENNEDTSGKNNEKRRFIMPCPGEECRGFLSTDYKCDLCSIQTCPKCLEVIGTDENAEHICNEDNVKSAEMIRKDTKPCPSCGTRIYKIDGCDQMWCVECHQAFSWKTGNIDNGRIHNPHFYQHKRNENNGMIVRAPGDVLCGGLVGVDLLKHNIIRKLEFEVGDKVYINVIHANQAEYRERGRLARFGCRHVSKRSNVFGKITSCYNKEYDRFEVTFAHEDVFNCSHCVNENGVCYAFGGKQTKNCKRILLHSTKENELYELHQFVTHITYSSLPRARTKAADNEYDNTLKMVRVRYILGQITKDEMMSEIYPVEKNKEKNIELLHIYEILSVVGIELFTNLANSTKQGADFNAQIKEQMTNYRKLCDYCNEQFAQISISYNVTVEQIGAEWKVENKMFSIRSARKLKNNPAKTSLKKTMTT